MPELPTIAEQGLPGYAAVSWFGIVGPANLPANVVATLHKATLASLEQKDVRDRLANSGVEVRTLGPEEFAKYTESETIKWAKVIKASGATGGLAQMSCGQAYAAGLAAPLDFASGQTVCDGRKL